MPAMVSSGLHRLPLPPILVDLSMDLCFFLLLKKWMQKKDSSFANGNGMLAYVYLSFFVDRF
jgi:hypothetical protein